MGTPVTIASDWTFPLVVMPHSGLFTGMAGIVGDYPIYPHVEPPVPIDYLPGTGSHLLTSTVFHKGMAIAQNHHDCGAGIPHVCCPPDNVFLPLFLIFSKRKIYFGASTVKMQGTPAGLAAHRYPMLTCADICSMPVTFAFDAAANTVYLGATAGDGYRGWAQIFTQMSVEALIYLIATGIEKYILHKLIHNEVLLHLVVKGIIYGLKALWGRVFSNITHSADHATTSDHGDSEGPGDAHHTGPSRHAAPPDASRAAWVTPSPFGDAVMTVRSADDGSFAVTTEAPAADGSRHTTLCEGLPLVPHTGDASISPQTPIDPLAHLVAAAPLL